MQKPGLALSIVMLIVLLAIPQLISYWGATQTIASVGTWYQGLEKPPLNPPNWTFGVVWTALYLMMGFASWLVWRAAGGFRGAPIAFALYFIQLAFNLAWSFLFFGLQQPGIALLDLVVVALGVFLTIVLFWRRSRLAGLLLIPYLAWVCFAAYLNAGIWILNG